MTRPLRADTLSGAVLEVVWRVVEVEVPSLLIVVEKLIEDLERS